MQLPGPRGWFPLIFLLLAVISFPVWVAFHSGTVGTLAAWITGTATAFNGSAHFVWGLAILLIVTAMSLLGGYKALERAQIAIVAVMLLSVIAAFFFLEPQWSEFFAGLFVPRPVSYPEWAFNYAEIRTRPIWVETITYVGIIGGSAYDYLAYVSYVREKKWDRTALRTILFDSIFSFLAVLIFTAVFTSLGALILRPQHQIPSGTDLLSLQAQFVTPIFPALKYLYFVGAFLAVFGTLYGTIEVAPAIWREIALAIDPKLNSPKARVCAVLWVCVVAAIFLATSLMRGNLPALVSIVTPANLFTGVLACGFVCWLAVWADYKWLAPADRMPIAMAVLNVIAGVMFIALGVKGYYDYHSGVVWLILAATFLIGMIAAFFLRLEMRDRDPAPAPSDLL